MKEKLLLACVLFALPVFANAAVPNKERVEAYAVVNGALQAWEHGDWKKMYGFMSQHDKDKTSIKVFIKKRSDIEIIEKLSGYSILSSKIGSDGSLYVTVKLTILKGPDTKVLPSHGWVPEEVTTTWHLICESPNDWKISFTK